MELVAVVDEMPEIVVVLVFEGMFDPVDEMLGVDVVVVVLLIVGRDFLVVGAVIG